MSTIELDFEGVSSQLWDELYETAAEVRDRAWAPYSEFSVGAAILTESDEIIGGCNVENASVGATVCAERTAIGTAVAGGDESFRALCVVTDADPPEPPCGICRQVLAEFCDELPILIANLDGSREWTTLSELFPHSFVRRPGESPKA